MYQYAKQKNKYNFQVSVNQMAKKGNVQKKIQAAKKIDATSKVIYTAMLPENRAKEKDKVAQDIYRNISHVVGLV